MVNNSSLNKSKTIHKMKSIKTLLAVTILICAFSSANAQSTSGKTAPTISQKPKQTSVSNTNVNSLGTTNTVPVESKKTTATGTTSTSLQTPTTTTPTTPTPENNGTVAPRKLETPSISNVGNITPYKKTMPQNTTTRKTTSVNNTPK